MLWKFVGTKGKAWDACRKKQTSFFILLPKHYKNIDGLAQDYSNCSALAMEILQSSHRYLDILEQDCLSPVHYQFENWHDCDYLTIEFFVIIF